MAYTTIGLKLGDGLARLTLNRPDRPNSLTAVMHQEIADALDAVESDQDTRVEAFMEKRPAVFLGR